MPSIPPTLERASGLTVHPGNRETARKIPAHEDHWFGLRRRGIPSSSRPADRVLQPDGLRAGHPLGAGPL